MDVSEEIKPAMNAQATSGTQQPARKRIGEILIEAGLITETDLAAALVEAKKKEQRIGQVLVRQNKISSEQLGKALSIQHRTKYIRLSGMSEVDAGIMALLPEEFVRQNEVVPVGKERGKLVVAMVDPGKREVINEITFITGMRPLVGVTPAIEFQEFYSKHLSESASHSLIEEISSAARSIEIEALQFMVDRDFDASDPSNPLVKLVNSIIEEAIERNASDIHIEPRHKKYLIRYRVDGILRTILDVPQNMEASFVTRVKVMGRMDIAEHRRPQDGRFSITYKGSEYNLRVNTLPVTDGREKIVIRILRPSKSISDFDSLGLEDYEVDKMELLYKSPHGIILACGPTGSGKTTTLYTMLNYINDDVRNICTVEDPIELTIEGLNQSQVNPKADYTFASSMRALLRQDPDVIMVGEIRDYETLEAAVHAALTGHLVFSTIHSNTTAGTITRMIEMGAASNLIGSALVGVLAQRLVRTVCPYCKVPYEASYHEKKVLFPYDEEKQQDSLVLHKGEGCELCGTTGYSGRTGVFEILVVDREIRQLINESASDLEIEDAAIAAGMRTLGMAGRAKVLAGQTTVAEMTRVLGVNMGGQ